MTTINARSWTSRASSSKRLSSGSRLATVLGVLAAVLACVSAAGCSRDGGRVEQAQAADSTPMLPGARGAFSARASAGGKAQRFDTSTGSPEPGAPGALLPPVMHTAD